ncbi:MAG TPA: NUDIX domain-containing protein [Trueperaceae bacterium]|nr:NUDIX domain-containing protein [Trueperaceae bacterium]
MSASVAEDAGGSHAGPRSAGRDGVTRDLAATVFVAWRGKLLMHRHRKLGMWLPCGGHVEPHELPDDAAVREVLEEAGVHVELVGEPPLSPPGPRQLTRPRGVQLETIGPGHEHIDLIYLGRPVEPYDGRLDGGEEGLGWYDRAALERLELTDEVRAWTRLALEELE